MKTTPEGIPTFEPLVLMTARNNPPPQLPPYPPPPPATHPQKRSPKHKEESRTVVVQTSMVRDTEAPPHPPPVPSPPSIPTLAGLQPAEECRGTALQPCVGHLADPAHFRCQPTTLRHATCSDPAQEGSPELSHLTGSQVLHRQRRLWEEELS